MKNKSEKASDVLDNLRRIFQTINNYSKNAELSTGLTGPQLWAVKILAHYAPIRVSDLAHNMHLRSATVVGIIDRLEGKGLVTRTQSKQDRRAVNLQLTEKGLAVAAKAPEVAQALLLKGLEDLSDEQFYCVDEGMKQMVRMLGAEQLTPQPLHS